MLNFFVKETLNETAQKEIIEYKPRKGAERLLVSSSGSVTGRVVRVEDEAFSAINLVFPTEKKSIMLSLLDCTAYLTFS